MNFSHPLPAIIGLIILVGCSTVDVQGPLDVRRPSYRDKLAADSRLTKQFLACLAQAREGEPDSTEPAVEPVRALIQRVREHSSVEADSLTAVKDLSSELAQGSHPRFDVAALHRVVAAARRWQNEIGSEQEDLLRDASRFTRLLSAYNRAYFGNLRFVADESAPPGSPRRVLRVTSSGFVDRGGTALLFPGLSGQPASAAGGPIHDSGGTVTSQRVSADLTRVFLEAFFDAAFEVPAVHGSTALRVEWAAQDRPYPEFETDHSAITPDDLSRITRDALRVEAAVTTDVGKAVRGGGGAGANNETLAAALETAAGVTAKKLVEHEGFCYFQVKRGPGVTAPPPLGDSPTGPSPVEPGRGPGP